MKKFIFAAVAAAVTVSAMPAFAEGYGYARPQYHKPTYGYTHSHEERKVTTHYEHRKVYFYEQVKVAGYCKDVVKKDGYNVWRKTVECKKGELPVAEKPAPAAEPAPEEPAK